VLAWSQGLRHQSRRLPQQHTRHCGVRDRRLPPALRDREVVPNVQARPADRPIYHHKRGSIEAHLSVVSAALAVNRWIEACTDWSIKEFVRTARRYRIIEIQADGHNITAVDPLPNDLPETLTKISSASPCAH
jgi:hypothetical protein